MTHLRSLAHSLYRRFHGRPVRTDSPTSIHAPKTLILLGQAIAIVYKCNKLHGGGDGKTAEYEHEFETPVGLYMDETGKKQLYLIGRDLKVTAKGIEN